MDGIERRIYSLLLVLSKATRSCVSRKDNMWNSNCGSSMVYRKSRIFLNLTSKLNVSNPKEENLVSMILESINNTKDYSVN